MIRTFSSVYVLEHSGFAIKCCPMADSKLILDLLFLHIRGGCSLAALLFLLMLVGTCCFILSANLCVVRPAKTFLCSFDMSSLFTNVPLDETIEICADALYQGHLGCPPFPEDTFRELMLIATRGVEFSFNNQMYEQLDGVAMGSPLGPALANIFVGVHESRLFDNTAKPGVYFRYVNDSFVIFGSELDCDHFQEKLNLLHPALQFTIEKEQHNLNFLDVLVEKKGTRFLTSIYRKPTFTGQYIRWNSFSPKTRKISLVKTLVHRALMICSKTKLGPELDKIK